MAKVSVVPSFSFGGVATSDNPLALRSDRSLRCRNWIPVPDGLELRDGYSTVTQTTTTATAIHSIIPYRLLDQTKYVILGQGSGTPKLLAVASGTITTPTVKGTAFSSSNKADFYIANNRLHYANGVDQKYFDGTNWRNNGLRVLTDTEIANVIIAEGVRELTSAQGTSVTLATSGAAGLATTTLSGYGICVAIFDTTANELGPATFFASASKARITVTAGPKQVDIAVMPDLSGTNAAWVKLIARTVDGGSRAYFVTKAASMTAVTLTRSGSTGTFSKTTHGYSTGDCLIVSGATDTKWNKVWSITVLDANTFTVTLAGNDVAANFSTSETGLTTSSILKAANAATTATLNTSTTDTSYIVNQDRGLAATTITSSTAGYQFYASIYNRTSGHVGNRLAIGGRIAQTSYRFNVRITGLPDLSGSDTEYDLLIGRTGEAAAVPYAVTDGTNWIYCGNSDTKITIVNSAIDGTAELPSRNGVIPATIDKVCVVNKRVYANKANSPYIYKSGSLSDDINVVGTSGRAIQVGRPEQAFSPNDLETFPTVESLTGIAAGEYPDSDGIFAGTVCWSQRNCAVFVERVRYGAIEAGWRGPWAVGMAGSGTGQSRAQAQTPYGRFWVTGDKQLATFQNGVPVGVSGEYESGLLAKIGDAYLATTEVRYVNIPSDQIDELRIECQDSSGNPFTVIHDFKLDGQGYESTYAATSALASAFTSAMVLDSSGAQQIWASPQSGTGIGQLYLLNDGATDGGVEFSADYITLLPAGESRPSVPFIDWYGDQNVTVSIGKKLKSQLTGEFAFSPLVTSSSLGEVPQGEEDMYHYRAALTTDNCDGPEIKGYAYLRLQLTSHSADGNMDLSDPPHVPLEFYGRIYKLLVGAGAGRPQ